MLDKLKAWSLTSNEKFFIKNQESRNSLGSSISIFQCAQDFDYLNILNEVTKSDKNNIHGIQPRVLYANFFWRISLIPYFLKWVHHFFLRKKWKKLYLSIGVEKFYYVNRLSGSIYIINLIKAIKVFCKITCKSDILNLNQNEIKCGDLIYDSYLRFENKPTVSISDLTLISYIHDCFNQISYFENLSKKVKIENYYSPFSSYISHGIPVRVFLKNNINIQINHYTVSGEIKNKILSLKDVLHVKPYWQFKEILNTQINKEELILKGYNRFKKRFKGYADLSYMNENQYANDNSETLFTESFEGIVFLHDFFDSPHIYREMLFEDFYEWLLYLINLTLKHSLNIAFKLHPNQLPENQGIIDMLKLQFPEIKWIDQKVSNKSIFDSGIKYGLSVYGTVLPELAFHGIKPISCGDNPASDFDFVFQAKTKSEYEYLILNHINLKLPEDLTNQLGSYYYMNYLYKHN
ncbi:hypothetical protein N9848_06100 [Flavobacteriaceae bacterium]|nr:hypothetical protein [Flavobacteriaceae bacterium]